MDPHNFKLSPEAVKELQDTIVKIIESTGPISNEPEVKIIADSISPGNHRLTTFQLKFWRPILPELNRHRALSQSVRSSRAVPVATIIKEIKESPWGPCDWGKKQRGMVADEVFTDPKQVSILNSFWFQSAQAACSLAQAFDDAGVHQQIVNRTLEPYTCTHAVVTATEWDNFFKLRCASDAEPNFRKMAILMKEALEKSTPALLDYTDWHLPYVSEEEKITYSVGVCRDISAARCARVSYKLFDGTTSVKQDLSLAEKLITSCHMSPLEHVATPLGNKKYGSSNFVGWTQYRKWVEADREV